MEFPNTVLKVKEVLTTSPRVKNVTCDNSKLHFAKLTLYSFSLIYRGESIKNILYCILL